jgi:uncharacterized protein YecE (DUF72 family)
MFERRHEPLLSRSVFLWRLAKCAAISLGFILVSLVLGVLGYRQFEGMPWIDSFVNAAMILGGMGPVGELYTDAGKLFAASTHYTVASSLSYPSASLLLLSCIVSYTIFTSIPNLMEDEKGTLMPIAGYRPDRSKEPLDLEKFEFRGLHSNILIGTASDRYSGWIGQIYSPDRCTSKITRRTNQVAGKSFIEEVLPVESVEEYFEHFRVLEIDFTFYRLLIDQDGQPTQNLQILKSYRSYAKRGDYFVLKVPQTIFAQKLRREGGYVENEAYLNPEVFARQFYEPALKVLGPNLSGFVFEQEYQRVQDRRSPKEMASALDAFFSSIPKDKRYHVELRTEAYLSNPVFEVLEKHGVGQVLSHWTWLPPLRKQFAKAGRRFFNSGRQGIIRLMTPRGTRCEDAYAMAHPFDKLVEGMLSPETVKDTVELMREGIKQGMSVNVIINNRAGGNAPLIARLIAQEFPSGIHPQ